MHEIIQASRSRYLLRMTLISDMTLMTRVPRAIVVLCVSLSAKVESVQLPTSNFPQSSAPYFAARAAARQSKQYARTTMMTKTAIDSSMHKAHRATIDGRQYITA